MRSMAEQRLQQHPATQLQQQLAAFRQTLLFRGSFCKSDRSATIAIPLKLPRAHLRTCSCPYGGVAGPFGADSAARPQPTMSADVTAALSATSVSGSRPVAAHALAL